MVMAREWFRLHGAFPALPQPTGVRQQHGRDRVQGGEVVICIVIVCVGAVTHNILCIHICALATLFDYCRSASSRVKR